MNKLFKTSLFFICVSLSAQANSQTSMQLEEACYSDIELTEYIVEVIQNGSSSLEVVSSEEATQISSLLASEEIASLELSEKLKAVLTACAEGRILQTKNSRIINAPLTQ